MDEKLGLCIGDEAQKIEDYSEQELYMSNIDMRFVWIDALQMWVGKYPVTNKQYRMLVPDHNSTGDFNGPQQPVVVIDFNDICAYVGRLTHREREAMRLPKECRYRLPTEKEWETFARCGDNREYPWGNEWPPKYGHYNTTAATCNVEESGRNEWGLYGIGGNVWECCTDDVGALGAWRGASRGYFGQNSFRVDYRFRSGVFFRGISFGFRLVIVPEKNVNMDTEKVEIGCACKAVSSDYRTKHVELSAAVRRAFRRLDAKLEYYSRKAKEELALAMRVECLAAATATAKAHKILLEEISIADARLTCVDGDGDDLPEECECDNTHEQNNTVCRWCWAHGRRKWNDPEV